MIAPSRCSIRTQDFESGSLVTASSTLRDVLPVLAESSRGRSIVSPEKSISIVALASVAGTRIFAGGSARSAVTIKISVLGVVSALAVPTATTATIAAIVIVIAFIVMLRLVLMDAR